MKQSTPVAVEAKDFGRGVTLQSHEFYTMVRTLTRKQAKALGAYAGKRKLLTKLGEKRAVLDLVNEVHASIARPEISYALVKHVTTNGAISARTISMARIMR
jgi:hypothetical protein